MERTTGVTKNCHKTVTERVSLPFLYLLGQCCV
nr:MAG TPA: hypothetical protein [Caudoviricetes sp.]